MQLLVKVKVVGQCPPHSTRLRHQDDGKIIVKESSPRDDDMSQHSCTSRSSQDGIAYLDVNSALAEFIQFNSMKPARARPFLSLPSTPSIFVFTPLDA